MAQTTLGGLVVHTAGSLPDNGTVAPAFILTGVKLRDIELRQFEGKNVILNIYPSVDTNTCATSTREFNKRASEIKDTVVICVSKDLPFAFRRFCGAEGIDKVLTASDFRNRGFASDYGVELIDGPFAGLFARAIVVIDKDGRIKHTELVSSIDEEPNYDAAFAAIQQ